MSKKAYGFTIVELLIVIVVIAILAAISIVAYTGIQQQARDTQRASDISQLTTALEAYYIDNGAYPAIVGSGSVINSGWATTADDSWQTLLDHLTPYAVGLGSDPTSTPGKSVLSSENLDTYNYAYFSSNAGSYCDVGSNQVYLLAYRFEARENINTNAQPCIDSSRSLGPYGSGTTSNYYGVK